MANLYIPVGIPGCGKSTFAQIVHDNYLAVLNTDAIRLELTRDINDQSRNDEVFGLFHTRIEDHLMHHNHVYADATNLRPYAREKLRAIADRVGANTHVYMFDNMEQAVLRNMERDRVVPPDVMIRFIAQFEQAVVDIEAEHYTSITTLRHLR